MNEQWVVSVQNSLGGWSYYGTWPTHQEAVSEILRMRNLHRAKGFSAKAYRLERETRELWETWPADEEMGDVK